MVEIVTRILPQLQHLSATEASMKSELVLLLGKDEVAQVAWACLSQWMHSEQGQAKLTKVREGLEPTALAADSADSMTQLRR